QAERRYAQAMRMVDRLRVNPRLANERDVAQAQAAFRSIQERFPATVWTRPERLERRYARDVASISGRAAIAVARLEEMRGRVAPALAGYERAARDYAALLPVRLEAVAARAATLERTGDPRTPDALTTLARDFPLVDPETGEPIVAVLDALLRVAQDAFAAGRHAAADSTLADAERRLTDALARARGRQAAPELWIRLARVRTTRGGAQSLEPTLDALRQALAEPKVGALRAQVVLMLGEYALAGGRPDSALVYARWAETIDQARARPEALMLMARVWEARGAPDSALAAYGRFVDSYPAAVDAGSVARYRRALLFEATDRWEQARSEYRALAAHHPAHELALESSLRIVAYHLGRGQAELARMEGRSAGERMDRLIATYRDDRIVMKAREARARVLLALADYGPACDALAELWQRYGSTPTGTLAALDAARVAEIHLGDPPRARTLYQEVAERGVGADAQRVARAALARMEGQGG
ncbi:MAG TPA: tetratricopeptide repeat protein, partial [Candidatus Limnocylindria bacterium]|nr:tetratricopeptide repeat protein [Candidatus Limnocylindria bacterium]